MGYGFNPEEKFGLTVVKRPLIPVNTPLPRPFRNIHISMDDPRLMRAVKSLGSMGGSILKVDVMWNGSAVTKVPAGDKFDINMSFQASNSGGGEWCIAGTVTAPDGTLPNYEIAKNNGISTTMGPGYITLNKYGQLTMPNNDITLRVRLFGYPFYNDTPPDRSLW